MNEQIKMLCGKFCTHGGQCVLPEDHEELLHSSGACEWPEEECITRMEADALMLQRPNGYEILTLTDSMEQMAYWLAGRDLPDKGGKE